MKHSDDQALPSPLELSPVQAAPMPLSGIVTPRKHDVDYVFYELTRSICPQCRRVIDAQILLRDNQVYMRKRCPEHGVFEALIYGDAQAYTASARFNKPGTLPLTYTTEIAQGCPYDCGLCPDHQQHACLGIIEVNSACNMDCPLCFANAGAGFNLTLEEVEGILDHLVETEGNPEVVQFSGGEPSIHPQIIEMMKAAKARNIRHVMLNTNGKRIADDDAFLSELAELHPSIYFQFDGFERETYRILRGEPDILEQKLRALDRLAAIGAGVVLVPA
ncbi:MAG: radical SAM protein, partial [Ktedonobacteraceae bacterium]